MTRWEYRTDNIPLQAGEPKRNADGKWQSGCTTAYLNEAGQEGWELVAAFPWLAVEGALSVNGPQTKPTVILLLKRPLAGE